MLSIIDCEKSDSKEFPESGDFLYISDNLIIRNKPENGMDHLYVFDGGMDIFEILKDKEGCHKYSSNSITFIGKSGETFTFVYEVSILYAVGIISDTDNYSNHGIPLNPWLTDLGSRSATIIYNAYCKRKYGKSD
jgi:hypothetical protein